MVESFTVFSGRFWNKLLTDLLHLLQVEEELPEVQARQVSVRRHEAVVGALRRGEGPALQEDEGEEAPQVAGTKKSFEVSTIDPLEKGLSRLGCLVPRSV